MVEQSRQASTLRAGSPATRPTWAARRDVAVTVLVWLIIGAIVIWVAAHVANALLILVIAALVAYAVSPLVKTVARALPKPLAVAVVYLVLLGALGGLGYVVVTTLLAELTALGKQLSFLLTSTGGGSDSPLTEQLKKLGVSQSQINSVTQQAAGQIQGIANGAIPLLGNILNGTLSALLNTVLVLVLSIYLLSDGPRVMRWLRTSMPMTYRAQSNFGLSTLQRVVGGYIRGQLLLSSLIGAVVGVGMALLHVPYAVLLGVLAFILEFIPTLGTLTSGVICILIAATSSLPLALAVLVYFVVVHVLEGYIVAPRVIGNAVGLHPVISILALVAGAELFGIIGALFASPVAGLLQAVCIAVWSEWRIANDNEFPEPVPATAVETANSVAEHAEAAEAEASSADIAETDAAESEAAKSNLAKSDAAMSTPAGER